MKTKTRVIDKKLIYNIAKEAKGNGMLVHIIARGNKWIVKKDGSTRAWGIYVSRDQAVTAARKYLQQGKITAAIVHDNTGGVDKTIS